MVKAVIFDADGTLWDSCPDIVISLNKVLKEYGLDEITYKDALPCLGYGAKKLCEMVLDGRLQGKDAEDFLNRYNYVYTNGGSANTVVYDGIAELLTELKRRGIKIALLSNKPQQTLDKVYEKYLGKYEFDYVYGQREGFKPKPDRQATDFVVENLGVARENIIFVGDSETDYQTGANADLRVITCLWGYRDKEFLLQNGAKEFINKPEELIKFL